MKLPFFPLATVILITSAAGQDLGSGNHKEAIADGLPGSQAGNAQDCLRLRILSLLHVSIPGQHKWVQRHCSYNLSLPTHVFYKNIHIQYTLLCLVGLTQSSEGWI